MIKPSVGLTVLTSSFMILFTIVVLPALSSPLSRVSSCLLEGLESLTASVFSSPCLSDELFSRLITSYHFSRFLQEGKRRKVFTANSHAGSASRAFTFQGLIWSLTGKRYKTLWCPIPASSNQQLYPVGRYTTTFILLLHQQNILITRSSTET